MNSKPCLNTRSSGGHQPKPTRLRCGGITASKVKIETSFGTDLCQRTGLRILIDQNCAAFKPVRNGLHKNALYSDKSPNRLLLKFSKNTAFQKMLACVIDLTAGLNRELIRK
jgi:hypothetical protein